MHAGLPTVWIRRRLPEGLFSCVRFGWSRTLVGACVVDFRSGFSTVLLMVVNSELPLAKSASVLRSPRSSSSKSGKTLFHISRIRLQSLPTRPINPAPLSAKVMCLDPIFTGQTVNRVTPDKVHQTNSNQSKIRFLLLARTSSPLFILLAGSICGIYFA